MKSIITKLFLLSSSTLAYDWQKDVAFYTNHFDSKDIQKKVADDIVASLQSDEIRSKIQAEIDKKAQEIVKHQLEIGKEWEKFYSTEKKLWDSFEQMTLKQKLTNVLEDLDKPGALDELWKNLEKQNDTVKTFTIDFDVESGKIDIQSYNQTYSG